MKVEYAPVKGRTLITWQSVCWLFFQNIISFIPCIAAHFIISISDFLLFVFMKLLNIHTSNFNILKKHYLTTRIWRRSLFSYVTYFTCVYIVHIQYVSRLMVYSAYHTQNYYNTLCKHFNPAGHENKPIKCIAYVLVGFYIVGCNSPTEIMTIRLQY